MLYGNDGKMMKPQRRGEWEYDAKAELAEEPNLELDEAGPDWAAAKASETWQEQLRVVERLLQRAPYAPAPAGFAERLMARIRQAMSEDMARLPADAHEAIASAYSLALLSTLPVLLSASWAMAQARGGKADAETVLRRLSEILQQTAADLSDLREDDAMMDTQGGALPAPALTRMTMSLVPLAVMNVFGEALRSLQGDLRGAERVRLSQDEG